MRRIVGFLLSLSLGLPTVVAANPIIDRNKSYYEVTGHTIAAIRSSLNRQSPVRHPITGQQFDAYTQWEVRWRYQWHKEPGQCEIRSVTVHYDVDYTLPRWRAPHGVDHAVQQRWIHYINSLNHHEKRHDAYGERAAIAIEEALWQMGTFPSCQQLSAQANLEANAILQHYIELEKRFDRRTHHGATQGARFP